jgi:hypothetical protein
MENIANEGANVLDIEDDPELAALFDCIIQPNDNPEKEASENVPLPLEGIPKILLQNLNERTGATYYNNFTAAPVESIIKDYIVDIYNFATTDHYDKVLPGVGKTIVAICKTYNLAETRVRKWVYKKKNGIAQYSSASRPRYLTDDQLDQLRMEACDKHSIMECVSGVEFLRKIRALILKDTPHGSVKITRRTFLEIYRSYVHIFYVSTGQPKKGSRASIFGGILISIMLT